MSINRTRAIAAIAGIVVGAVCTGVGVGPIGLAEAAPTLRSADIAGPAGSELFPEFVSVLDNGNFVVVDSAWDSPTAVDVGAVRLYDGRSHDLISTLTGSTAQDLVGVGGVLEVGGSNFVVGSRQWHNGAASAGAATWVNGTTGLNGPVTTANSLVGTVANSSVGEILVALENGNYVVGSPQWSNGVLAENGAVTWGNGSTGVVGTVSAANSLVGAFDNDSIGGGQGIDALPNGHYVVTSDRWGPTNLGAVTWGNGNGGTIGDVGPANSLVGTTANDSIGSGRITVLTNGNYVVNSPKRDTVAFVDAGAATWGNGNGGTVGSVLVTNSLVGTHAGDHVGDLTYGLTNGNYVVNAPDFDGGVADIGSSTWANGLGGTIGGINIGNSLLGSVAQDRVGVNGVVPLENGNYVVVSSVWNNGAIVDAGAATWGNGAGGTVGTVAATNSYVGSTALDRIGGAGNVALANGNYVVRSPQWDNGGVADAGAATFGSGLGGSQGPVSAANSLVGSTVGDGVGSYGVEVLDNDSYVVLSSDWDRGAVVDAGAVTWGSGATGVTGAITATNSLLGSTANDHVGWSGVATLTNGNFVVGSSNWSNGSIVAAGAATFARGDGSTVGSVTTANSLYGTQANDAVGDGLSALANGDYLVRSATWDDGAVVDVGAVVGGSGSSGRTGPVTAANSLHGSTAGDRIGAFGVFLLDDGRYVLLARYWDNGAVIDAGAMVVIEGSDVGGTITAANALLGTVTDDLDEISEETIADGSYVVSRRELNKVTLLNPGPDYLPSAPVRLLDTRTGFATIDGQFAGVGELAGESVLELPVAGRGAVPADALAATLNVTVTEAVAPGFLTVYPCGSPRPTASNLNYGIGKSIPNAVLAKIGNTGTVCFFASQPLQLIVDVNGSFPNTTSYRAINPSRVIDTRAGFTTGDGIAQGTGQVGAGSVTTVQITGRAGVPLDATAVALNVTISEPTIAGYATVYPCGSEPPTASNLNYTPGLTIPNLVVSKLGTGGTVCVYSQSATQIIADVNGYFPASTTFTALIPARLLDSRPNFPTVDGVSAGAGLVALGTVTKVHVLGRGGVPAGAETVVLNMTVTEATAEGYVTVYPCGIEPPNASNVNFVAGETIPNAVVSAVGTNGDICIFTSQATHLITDVTGYFP